MNGPSLIEGAEILSRVCAAIDDQNIADASSILTNEYPFEPLANVGRRYSALQCMLVFARDGFIDRYSGRRLVFPGTLRLLSRILPLKFPFHNNWKTDACHFAFYELFPTIDHLVPVSRGGADNESNWVSTSMIRNAAKSNFTVEELGWQTAPPGSLREWLASRTGSCITTLPSQNWPESPIFASGQRLRRTSGRDARQRTRPWLKTKNPDFDRR